MPRFFFASLLLILITSLHAQNSSWDICINNTDKLASEENCTSLMSITYDECCQLKLEKVEECLIVANSEYGKESAKYLETLNWKIKILKNCQQDSLAKKIAENALRQYKALKGEERLIFAITQGSLAQIYIDEGAYLKAEQLLKNALEIKGEILGGESYEYGITCNTLAHLLALLERFDEQEKYLLKAVEIFENHSSKKPIEYIKVANNLGVYYYRRGYYVLAKEMLEKVVEKARGIPNQERLLAAFLINLGGIQLDLGSLTESLNTLREVKTICEQYHDTVSTTYSNVLTGIAVTKSRLGDNSQLELYYKKSLEIIEKIHNGVENKEYILALNNLGHAYTIAGKLTQAEQTFLQAQALLEKVFNGNSHSQVASVFKGLGKIKTKEQNHSQAQVYFRKTVDIQKVIYGDKHPFYRASLARLARAYDANMDFVQADSTYRALRELLIYLFVEFYPGLQDWEKLGYLDQIESITDHMFSYGIRRLPQHPELAGELLDFWLQLREIVLRTSPNNRQHLVNQKDSTLLALYEDWWSVSKAKSKLINQKGGNQFEKEGLVDSLNALLTIPQKKLFENHQARFSWLIHQGSSWKNIKENLKEGEIAIIFIDYHFCKPPNKRTDTLLYGAWLIKANSIQPQYIHITEKWYLDSLLAVNWKTEKEFKRVYNQLSRILFDPIEQSLVGMNTLYISRIGDLHRISFSVLSDKSKKMLLDKYRLIYLDDPKSLLRKSASSRPERAILFGGIDFGPSISSQMSWDYLPASRQEVDNSAKIMAKNSCLPAVYSGGQGTEEMFNKSIEDKQVSILHIATHGYYIPPGPYPGHQKSRFSHLNKAMKRTALILAGANQSAAIINDLPTSFDGLLSADEVTRLYLSDCELVVLASCKSALGDIHSSEGVFGLQRAFRLAGANAILMSLWDVPDDPTQELITHFYQEYLKGSPKHEALVAAQKALRKKYRTDYWAGFVLLESSKPDISTQFSFWWIVIGSGCLLLFTILFFHFQKTRR